MLFGTMRSIFFAAVLVLSMFGVFHAEVASAQTQCAQPVSTGEEPTASDCLYILRVAVGTLACPEADCLCDTDGSGATTATDALGCLKRAVGDQGIDLICCGSTTTTSTTSTTMPAGGFDPMVRLTGGGCGETLEANGLVWTVPGVMVDEQSEYQAFPGEMIGPFTWSSDSCGGDPIEDLVIPTVWRLGRADGCRYALNALNGVAGVVSVISEFGISECRPELISQ